MSADKEPLLMDHDADGITELDNHLPRWWVWLFVLCCVWAFGYLLYFHVMGGPGQIEQYKREMAAAGTPVPDEVTGTGGPVTAPVVIHPPVSIPSDPSAEENVLSLGKAVFTKNCMVCHGPDGGGLIGPNMTDDYFLHGPLFSDTVNVILHGVPAKGMIAWQGTLKPKEIHAVASYVYSLRGTTPATPKPPEGTQVKL